MKKIYGLLIAIFLSFAVNISANADLNSSHSVPAVEQDEQYHSKTIGELIGSFINKLELMHL